MESKEKYYIIGKDKNIVYLKPLKEMEKLFKRLKEELDIFNAIQKKWQRSNKH